MRKNLVLPYAIIAIIGILTVIIISYVGVNQREAIQNPDEGEDAVVLNVEDVYKNNCSNCHGGDLTGASAPALADVGSKFSEDEINNIIINGTDGGMPAGLVDAEQAALLAEWLSEME
jgi:cytochrome c550